MTTAAAAPAPGHDLAQPLAYSLGFETIRLPAGERMGLLGGALLFEVQPAWWLGPALYGAASGERGGLFVGGLELQRRWRLGETAQLAAGLYAGGGGGAAAPVGGGLMLRPAVTLLQSLGPLHAGLSWSQVRFSGGGIRSQQAGLVLAWDGRFRYADAARVGSTVQDTSRSGLGVDHMAGTLTGYRVRGAGAASRRLGLVGVRMEQRSADGHTHWGAEAAAAASGDAAGYMEVLASAGWETAFLPPWAPAVKAGVRGALGLGGGGNVPTGGGVIGKAMLTLSAQLSPRWRTGIEAGWLRAADAPLRADTAQWWLSLALEPARQGNDLPTASPLARTEWAGVLQRQLHVRRKDGASAALDTIGLKLNRYLGEHVYLSGQAHSAYGGGAGAYSIGLVGAGLTTAAPSQGWQAGAELLLGAAGGGGVATGNGAVLQAMAWGGWSAAPQSQWRLGVGGLHSLKGGVSSPLVELSWVWAFGQPAP